MTESLLPFTCCISLSPSNSYEVHIRTVYGVFVRVYEYEVRIYMCEYVRICSRTLIPDISLSPPLPPLPHPHLFPPKQQTLLLLRRHRGTLSFSVPSPPSECELARRLSPPSRVLPGRLNDRLLRHGPEPCLGRGLCPLAAPGQDGPDGSCRGYLLRIGMPNPHRRRRRLTSC